MSDNPDVEVTFRYSEGRSAQVQAITILDQAIEYIRALPGLDDEQDKRSIEAWTRVAIGFQEKSHE